MSSTPSSINPPKKVVKRFIAGVVCPKCAEMDKTRMYRNEQGEEIRECVACGFNETYSEHKADSAAQRNIGEEAGGLATRVTPVGKALLDEEEKPLRILGLGNDDKS